MEFVDYKCLESLLITGEEIAVTEGLTDKIKSAAKFIGKGLMTILNAIKRILVIIANKVRTLMSRKQESPKDMAARLMKENEELKSKLSNFEDELNSERLKSKDLEKKNETLESKNDKATEMIASLKKKIDENDNQIKSIEKSKKMKSRYNEFQKTALAFIALVSQQNQKVYTILPRLIDKAKRHDNSKEDDVYRDRDFMRALDSSLPTMSSGSWSVLYKNLKYNYLPDIKESNNYIFGTPEIYRGFQILINESERAIRYLENMVDNIDKNGTENNPAYKIILEEIMDEEGCMDMLYKSINIANEIITVYVNQGYHYYGKNKSDSI